MDAVDAQNMKNLKEAGEKMTDASVEIVEKMVREICDEKFGGAVGDEAKIEEAPKDSGEANAGE